MGGHRGELFPGTSGSVSADNTANTAGGATPANSAESSAGEATASTRDQLMARATTDQARGIVNELYRPNAETGDGGTADAIREQLRTGKLIGGRDHIRKGKERLRQLEKLLKRQPNHPDRDLLIRLRDDLSDALGGNK